jgi:SAM-dependent methyltransferase
MAGQIDTGARRALSIPRVYRAVQDAVGAEKFRRYIAARYLQHDATAVIIDVGCGTADMLRHLRPRRYVGFDPSPAYISQARREFGERGEFIVAGLADQVLNGLLPETADRVIAIGVLHHLDDSNARSLFQLMRSRLAAGGTLTTVDPAFVPGQPRIARWLAANDRGQHVRDPATLASIARLEFDDVTTTVHQGLLRVPYSHVVVEARWSQP